MDRTFASAVSATPPSAPASPAIGYPRPGDPGGSSATKPGAYWYYMITESLRNVVVAGGLTPDHTNLTQVLQAIQSLSSLPAGAIVGFAMTSAPAGYLKANGAAVSVSTYSALATNIYCGDSNNAAASWGYRCTNPASPTSTRSTIGSYIVLPDYRGEFRRGFDDARGIDSGRSLWSYQLDAMQGHRHAHQTNAVHNGTSVVNIIGSGLGNYQTETGDPVNDGVNGAPRTASETRSRNGAELVCIKY